jgi:hypothetical protein
MMPIVLRRLLLWTFICGVSAGPSFFVAHRDFDRAAMVLGVALFIAGYTATTSTAAFERFHNRPFVRRTFYIGYGARLLLSLAFPLALVAPPISVVIFTDVMPGVLSFNAVKALGVKPESFPGTLLTTMVQGALLNAIVIVFMLLVYAVQRTTMKPPPERSPRGFDVVLPAERMG